MMLTSLLAIYFGQYGPKSYEVYCKGDFSGIIFCKCATEADQDKLIQCIRDANRECQGDNVWAKSDLPIKTRIILGLLFGIRKIMSEYYERNALWIDIEGHCLQICGDDALKIAFKDERLGVQFVKAWYEEVHCADLEQLAREAEDKLKKGPVN